MRFQVHQLQQGAKPPKMNTQVSALRFFLKITLGRLDLVHALARVDYPRRLPRVLPMGDVARLLEAAPGPGLQYKAALSIAYGAGLRSEEVVMLRVADIDSKRMLIRVEQGKGKKDRYGLLSPQLVPILRAWWLQCRSQGWLFPGKDQLLPISTRQLNRACHMAADAAGLGTWITPRTLRHSFATHLMEAGVDVQNHPSVARAFEVGHDRALYSRRHQLAAHHRKPARSSDAADPYAQAKHGAGRVDRHTCPVQHWRSRTSSATTVLLGVMPTRAASVMPS